VPQASWLDIFCSVSGGGSVAGSPSPCFVMLSFRTPRPFTFLVKRSATRFWCENQVFTSSRSPFWFRPPLARFCQIVLRPSFNAMPTLMPPLRSFRNSPNSGFFRKYSRGSFLFWDRAVGGSPLLIVTLLLHPKPFPTPHIPYDPVGHPWRPLWLVSIFKIVWPPFLLMFYLPNLSPLQTTYFFSPLCNPLYVMILLPLVWSFLLFFSCLLLRPPPLFVRPLKRTFSLTTCSFFASAFGFFPKIGRR